MTSKRAVSMETHHHPRRELKVSRTHPSNQDTTPPPPSVMVEAVKCLCNLVLSCHSLAVTCTDLGVLHGLSLRLRLVRTVDLPPHIVTFDLRLLFLITACGVVERYSNSWLITAQTFYIAHSLDIGVLIERCPDLWVS